MTAPARLRPAALAHPPALLAGDAAINVLLGHRRDSPEAATYRAQEEAIRLAEEARAKVRERRNGNRPTPNVETGGTTG